MNGWYQFVVGAATVVLGIGGIVGVFAGLDTIPSSKQADEHPETSSRKLAIGVAEVLLGMLLIAGATFVALVAHKHLA